MKRIVIGTMICVCLASCTGTPYQEGQKLAAKYDACIDEYFDAFVQVGEDFANKIEGKYNSRSSAMDDYLKLLRDCHQEYLEKWRKIYDEEQKMYGKIKTSTEKSEFEDGLHSNREYFTFVSVPELETIEISPAVLKKVRTIMPSKPDERQVAIDLIGHSLSEGKEEGYYPQSWTWKITENGISDLSVVSVQENSDSRYTITVSMKLSSETRTYDTKAIVSYVLDDIRDWEIEYVRSLGMDIVKTHKYDDLVKVYLDYGCSLKADNLSDIAIEVGGKYFQYDKWHVFRTVISPHDSERIPGNLSCVKDFIVDYRERP